MKNHLRYITYISNDVSQNNTGRKVQEVHTNGH